MENDQPNQTQEPVNNEVETPETPEPVQPEPSLPERTSQQFEKLTKTNQELKEERDHYKNVLESLRPDKAYEPPQPSIPAAQNYSHLNQNEVNNIAQGLVDENGFVDMNKLGQILQETNNRAMRAEQAARAAQTQTQETVRSFEESATMKQIHRDYPELDPKSDKFNEDFYDSVRNELVGQMLKGQKENVGTAAKKWHTRMFGTKTVETKEQKQQREEGQEARAAINSTPSRSATKSRTSSADHEALVQGTRRGDRASLKERLDAIDM